MAASTSAFQVVTPTPSSSSSTTRPASYHVHLSGHRNTAPHPNEDDDDDDLDDESYSTTQHLATPGQPLGSLSTYMRGHGTHLVTTTSSSASSPAPATIISSSLAGRILLTNRLLSLSPLSHRYTPETGDLLLGRITTVLPGARKWRVDISSTSGSASLALSAINLPGGVQRRKLASDELQMRKFFSEGDLLVAEVQGVFGDGGAALHTRSLRYGKLRNGVLGRVPCGLVRRGRSHFVRLRRPGVGEGGEVEVEMILGLNGWVWLSDVGAREGSASGASGSGAAGGEGQAGGDERGMGRDVDASGTYSDELKLPTPTLLTDLSLLSSLLSLLGDAYLPVSDVSVQTAWDVAVQVQVQQAKRDKKSSSKASSSSSTSQRLLEAIEAEFRKRGIVGGSAAAGGHGQDGDGDVRMGM